MRSRNSLPRLSITYVLEDTVLFGGVKVILQQANLMARRGHRVTVVSRGPEPRWFSLEAGFCRDRDLDPTRFPDSDVTVASYWTTLAVAARVSSGEALHYCQGYEASHTHNRRDHAAIDEAYRHAMPAMVVAPHLARLIEQRFGRPARVVPQPLEPFWRPRLGFRPHHVPRILVVGPFEIDWKGVATALRAVLQLRESGMALELVRLSQWPLSKPERELLEPDEFHHHLRPEEAADLVRECDLLLAPSWEQEGFGLPVLEAMASGVPVVASDISCFRSFAANAALLVPFDDASAFSIGALEILGDREKWRRARSAGLSASRNHTEQHSADAAEAVLDWVATGAWRSNG